MPMLDNDCRHISSAPRDGTVIEVMDPDCGSFAMRWKADGFNRLASLKEGIWERPAAISPGARIATAAIDIGGRINRRGICRERGRRRAVDSASGGVMGARL